VTNRSRTSAQKTIWSASAAQDLRGIVQYIGNESTMDAISALNAIKDRVQALSQFPDKGRTVPELADQQITIYRELIIAPYRVIYRADETTIAIVAVFDSRRELTDVLLNRILKA
jgi:plasmid stabilization system protein ParE